MATAYDLSTAVLEWHAAGTPEQRLRTNICVKWQPSFFRDDADGASEEMNLKNESHQEQLNPSLLGVDYGTEADDDDDDEQDKVIDALEPATLIKDFFGTANELRPKDEELDDQSALRLMHDIVPDNAEADQLTPVIEGDQGNHLSNVGAYLRDCDTDISTILQDKDLNVQLDFTTLFPDLHPLGLLDVHPGPVPSEGKKKMEKRSDKDDPNKRIEDTSYTKLYPTRRFMYTKPTLLGPLQPSKHWKNGRWLSTEETSIVPDEGSGRIPDDSSNGNFHLLFLIS
jgi:chromatin modification-related protein VID21